jgi:hypothetical protein
LLLDCNLPMIRYTSFGMKAPIDLVKDKFDAAIINIPEFLNRFDFGYTVTGEYLPSFNVTPDPLSLNNPRVLSMYNGIRGNSNIESETNIGGSISHEFNFGIFEGSKIMLYPHVIHMLKAVCNNWTIPKTFKTLRSRMKILTNLLDAMENTTILYSGYRIEMTCYGGNIQSNLVKYEPLKHLSVKNFYEQMDRLPSIYRIPKYEYLANIRSAFEIFNPFTRGRDADLLPANTRRYFADLINALGINTDRSPRPSYPWQPDTLWKAANAPGPDVVIRSIEGNVVRVNELNHPQRIRYQAPPPLHPADNSDIIAEIMEKVSWSKPRKKINAITYIKARPRFGWGAFSHVEKVKVAEYIFAAYGNDWKDMVVLNKVPTASRKRTIEDV